MPDIASIGPSTGPISPVASPRPYGAPAPVEQRPTADRAEISDHARHLERLRSLPDVRSAKVDAIRDSIARGTYDTPERMKVALQRLLDDLTA
ncbi:MAG: flagellar biosynthesis anti-sigma factor FlgM [Phycisphaeraceae bacterium]|nr:flagellar biosynthesis anti-sigma factor FlgM [Phycisphaeraceae bacterium]